MMRRKRWIQLKGPLSWLRSLEGPGGSDRYNMGASLSCFLVFWQSALSSPLTPLLFRQCERRPRRQSVLYESGHRQHERLLNYLLEAIDFSIDGSSLIKIYFKYKVFVFLIAPSTLLPHPTITLWEILSWLKGARHHFFWNKKIILIHKYKLIISHFLYIKGGINYLRVGLGLGPLYGPEP